MRRPFIPVAALVLAMLAWRSTLVAGPWWQSWQAIGGIIFCAAWLVGLVLASQWRDRRRRA